MAIQISNRFISPGAFGNFARPCGELGMAISPVLRISRFRAAPRPHPETHRGRCTVKCSLGHIRFEQASAKFLSPRRVLWRTPLNRLLRENSRCKFRAEKEERNLCPRSANRTFIYALKHPDGRAYLSLLLLPFLHRKLCILNDLFRQIDDCSLEERDWTVDLITRINGWDSSGR